MGGCLPLLEKEMAPSNTLESVRHLLGEDFGERSWQFALASHSGNVVSALNYCLDNPRSVDEQEQQEFTSTPAIRPPAPVVKKTTTGGSASVPAATRSNRAKRRQPAKHKQNKKSMERLARRGGVKRIGNGVLAAMEEISSEFVSKTLQDSTLIMGSRKTARTSDIQYALKNGGRGLYI